MNDFHVPHQRKTRRKMAATAATSWFVMHDQEAILVGPELLVVTEIPRLCLRAPLCTIVQATSVADI